MSYSSTITFFSHNKWLEVEAVGSRWCLCIKHADLRAHFIDLDNGLSGFWCFLSSLTADFLVALQAFAS